MLTSITALPSKVVRAAAFPSPSTKCRLILDRTKYRSLSRRLCPSWLYCFSSRRRHTRCGRDWSSDVCSSDLYVYNKFWILGQYFITSISCKIKLFVQILFKKNILEKSNIQSEMVEIHKMAKKMS